MGGVKQGKRKSAADLPVDPDAQADPVTTKEDSSKQTKSKKKRKLAADITAETAAEQLQVHTEAVVSEEGSEKLADTGGVIASEATPLPRRPKRPKDRTKALPDIQSMLHPSLEYLKNYKIHKDALAAAASEKISKKTKVMEEAGERATQAPVWKFMKVRQTYLLQHLYDKILLPDQPYFPIMLSYIAGLAGKARETECKRAREIVQLADSARDEIDMTASTDNTTVAATTEKTASALKSAMKAGSETVASVVPAAPAGTLTAEDALAHFDRAIAVLSVLQD